MGAGQGGGAGHFFPYLVLTNSGTTICTLRGYPGVSFVGNGNGTQLGAPADRDTSVAVTTIVLAPGAAAHAQLNITVAANYDAATCQPVTANGFRVYPPDQTAALFVATSDYTACANASVKLLQVRALQSGPA